MTDLAAPPAQLSATGRPAHGGPSRRPNGTRRSDRDTLASRAAEDGAESLSQVHHRSADGYRGRGRGRGGRRGGRAPGGGQSALHDGERASGGASGPESQSEVDRLLSRLHISHPVEPTPAPSAQASTPINGHFKRGRATGGAGALDPAAPSFQPGAGPSGETLPGKSAGDGEHLLARKPKPRKGKPRANHDETASDSSVARSAKPKGAGRVRADGEVDPPAAGRSSRRAAFEQQSRLTDGRHPIGNDGAVAAANGRAEGKQAMRKERQREEEKDDLLSKLMRGLRQRPFLECPICFNAITPSQPIWSCLPPSISPVALTNHTDPSAPAQPAPHTHQACYTPFHLKCIRSWASQSLETDQARLASFGLDQEDGEEPSWRCPGCQKKREDPVGEYTCFCARMKNPEGKGGMPHSCGEACGRKRACGHACSLGCHPGPCPPCQVSLIVTCPSHHTPLTVKCALAHSPAHPGALSPICDEPCGRLLSCSTHTCDRLCHFGECGPCDETEEARCFCGTEEKAVECGWRRRDARACGDGQAEGEQWEGRWSCGRLCGRRYDCGIHECEETCHAHSLETLPCPFSPSQLTMCPCDQTSLAALAEPPRTACTDPIPTCPLPCPRSRACGHPCPLGCHHGPCPTCTAQVVRPCRCGEGRLLVPCAKLEGLESGLLADGSVDPETVDSPIGAGGSGIRCERVCRALRNCGKHECGRVCCPLAHLAKSKKGSKKGDLLGLSSGALGRRSEREPGEEMHDCPLTCGRLLGCGIHTCDRKDHKGKCGRCLQASYDELVCHCGRTVVYPPVPCGTTLSCPYLCTRPPPACGHPRSAHPCHQDEQCPPCPYLATKPCACGKDPGVKNVRCSTSADKVSCGLACGRLLPCGYHRCDRPCHPPPEAGGECGDAGRCTQTCSKPKKACGHPCTHACHAPARCPESEPCQTLVLQTCACGHLQQRASCGATGAHASRERQGLKCNSECLVRQRNARLAEALGIDEGRESRAGKTEWSEEMRRFARVNAAWIRVLEKTLGEFIEGGRAMQILPSMPQAKRTFVLQLAEPYRLNASLIDEPPNESVQIRRRADSKVPTPLLSAAAAPTAAATRPAWGGLTNLRAPVPTTAPGSSASLGPATGRSVVSLGTAGWARPASAQLSIGSGSGPGSGAESGEPSRAATPVAPSVLDQSGGPRAGGVSGGAGHAVPSGGLQVGRVGEVEDVDWDED